MHSKIRSGGTLVSRSSLFRRRASAQSLVEFALILPLLLVILLGIMEMGFVLFKNASITNGTRAGVRRASCNRYTQADIKNYVVSNAVGVGLAVDNVSIITTPQDASFPGSPPTVQIQTVHSHKWLMLSLIGLPTLNLSSVQKAIVVTYPPDHLTIQF